MLTPLLVRFRGLMIRAQKFRKIDQEMQGFRARSPSANREREGAEAMLIESVFQDNNKPQCVTHAKLLVEASKIFLLGCNFESPDRAWAFLGGELRAKPLVNELDESEKLAVHTASLHTASCVDLFLKKHERTDCASVLLGVKLRTTPMFYELELAKSTVHKARCVAVFLARKDCASVLLRVKLRTTPLIYELEPMKSTVRRASYVAVFLTSKDCRSALLGGKLGATLLEEFDEAGKSALHTPIEIVLQNDDRTDRMDVFWAPRDCTVEGLVDVVLSCTGNKVLALDDLEDVHYNAETIALTSSQDQRFMLPKKTRVSNSGNQHKWSAYSQGSEIFSGSCNALPIVTDDDAVSKRILWLLIKHGARVWEKNKLGLAFFFIDLLLGWIPSVDAEDESALLQGSTSICTWICIIIVHIALVYFTYKILNQPPPEPYLFSEKVRIWINGEIDVEVYDNEGVLVGSWQCPFFIADGDAVNITEWVTNLLNFVLHIFVQQGDGVKEISFNQMDNPEFIGMAKDVYLHNPDNGLFHYIGRSAPQNGAPSERDILRARLILM